MTKPAKRGRGGSYLLQADGKRLLIAGTDQQPDVIPARADVIAAQDEHKPKARRAKPIDNEDTTGGDQ